MQDARNAGDAEGCRKKAHSMHFGAVLGREWGEASRARREELRRE